MLKYAIKGLQSRRVVTSLYIFALTLTMLVGTIVTNVNKQVQDGFLEADNKYDVVVGPEGGKTQLVMSSIFFSDDPVGLLEYQKLEDIRSQRGVVAAIPLAMGDTYRGTRIVGTEVGLLEGYTYKEGTVFNKTFDVVVGAEVSKDLNLVVGSSLVASCARHGGEHDDTPYTVVGVLDEQGNAYDNTIFTSLESVWEGHSHQNTGQTTEDHPDHHEEQGEITAILLRTDGFQTTGRIIMQREHGVQYVSPTAVMRELLGNIDIGRQISEVMSSVVIFMGVMMIGVLTYFMMTTMQGDLRTLRFIGMGERKIYSYVLYQVGIKCITSILLVASIRQLLIQVASGFARKQGIVFNTSIIYKEEIYLIGVLVLICILPIMVYLKRGEDNE